MPNTWRVQTIARTTETQLHRDLAEMIRERRKAAGLTQVDVAKRLGRPQSFMTSIENGERRLDVVELINLAKAISFDPSSILTELMRRS